jgi:hypothetical protein
MDPIADLDVLRGHLDRLADRGLVVWLSPPGRGRMLTHGLLPAEKLEKVRMQLGMAGAAAAAQPAPAAVAADEDERPAPSVAEVAALRPAAIVAEVAALRPAAIVADALAARVTELERTVADLRDRLARLEADLGG